MSEIQIDHKVVADLAARLIALKQGIGAAETPTEAQAYKNSLQNACENHIDLLCSAYLDIQRQLAAERARVEALCDVISDANGIAYPFAEMQDKMTAILNAHAQGD